jgi:predicted enzyme related to lactoylglutathione lyase
MPLDLLVNIDVDDLATAEAFYCDAFGLRPGRRFGALGVELLGASAPLYLLAKPAGSRAAAGTGEPRRYERHWTPVHLDLVVPEIEAALARAQAAGAVLEGSVDSYAWGRIARCADPFGHGFCLVQFLNRGYDEIADPPDGDPAEGAATAGLTAPSQP